MNLINARGSKEKKRKKKRNLIDRCDRPFFERLLHVSTHEYI
jgi:hypothetical protein